MQPAVINGTAYGNDMAVYAGLFLIAIAFAIVIGIGVYLFKFLRR